MRSRVGSFLRALAGGPFKPFFGLSGAFLRGSGHALVTRPEDWAWSSARRYATGEECGVEIESHLDRASS